MVFASSGWWVGGLAGGDFMQQPRMLLLLLLLLYRRSRRWNSAGTDKYWMRLKTVLTPASTVMFPRQANASNET